jgi:uncharacterized cupredoxin-like copper-binding protein
MGINASDEPNQDKFPNMALQVHAGTTVIFSLHKKEGEEKHTFHMKSAGFLQFPIALITWP